MTRREFMEMVIADTTNETIADFARSEIEKMDRKNELAKSRKSKKSVENEPIKEKIYSVLNSDEVTTASVVAEKVEISTQKASALLRQMVEDGRITVEDVKVKGKGKQKGYKVA